MTLEMSPQIRKRQWTQGTVKPFSSILRPYPVQKEGDLEGDLEGKTF